MRLVALLLLAATLPAADLNTLTPEERREGFRLLFDGKTFTNWKDPAKKDVPNNAWAIEDGTLKTVVKGDKSSGDKSSGDKSSGDKSGGNKFSEDLITEKTFANFDLKFDWRIQAKGNTGLKYRIQKEIFLEEEKVPAATFERMMGRELIEHVSNRKTYTGGTAQVYTVGFEFQLLDDEGHPDGKKDVSHRTGALYSFIPATRTAAKTPGEWNTSRLIVKKDHFEHWLNGVLVLQGSLKDSRVAEGAKKRWGPAPAIKDWLVDAKPVGTIALQHHGDEVWFRNVKVRDLPAK
ncbi:MAG: DUF1080 domain-containing protein [Bryobacteraceae bacterium]|nr:DUF1080 domain-containing protein [Bryobacteraceae bacterium]